MTAIKVEHTHKAEIEFLLEQVLACSCFSNWMSLHVETHEGGILGHPMAYWEGKCWQVFWADEEDAEPFDPYHSLDDAWALIEGINDLAAHFQDIRWWELEKVNFCRALCEVALKAFDYYGEE